MTFKLETKPTPEQALDALKKHLKAIGYENPPDDIEALLDQLLLSSKVKIKYLTVPQTAAAYKFIPEGGLRHLIFTNEDFNKRVCKRLGKKVLIDVLAFEQYLADLTHDGKTILKNTATSHNK